MLAVENTQTSINNNSVQNYMSKNYLIMSWWITGFTLNHTQLSRSVKQIDLLEYNQHNKAIDII